MTVNLEYLLMFQKTGIPIYSRCFGNTCAIMMKDDVLLSGFLAALTALKDFNGELSSLNFEGQEIHLEFSQDGDLFSVDMGPTKLLFHFVETTNYFIVSGFPLDNFTKSADLKEIRALSSSIEQVMENQYSETSWHNLSAIEFDNFEETLLQDAVYPWMKTNKSPHTCALGNHCPFRAAVADPAEDEFDIATRLRNTYTNYRKLGMMTLMKYMMHGIKLKLFKPRAFKLAGQASAV
ncbi:MAG: hypothetical protein INQ03_15935 [Candidatus Heimdallarchaeota archaeon]|nr:hypothetical protein [Candidatus Heimdallarchaeota archaeon]